MLLKNGQNLRISQTGFSAVPMD